MDVTLNGLLWCEVWINRVTFYFTETCCYIFHKLFVCFLLILILTLFLLCFCTVICFISISLTYFILFYPLFLLSQSRFNCVSQFLLLWSFNFLFKFYKIVKKLAIIFSGCNCVHISDTKKKLDTYTENNFNSLVKVQQ